MDEEQDIDLDHEILQSKLLDAGFHHEQIENAFDWLEGLAELQDNRRDSSPVSKTVRVYHETETSRLDEESRGFLMFLEQIGVLDTTTRELVIDRVMALDSDDIDLEQVKWVIMMVLFNQPGEPMSYTWLENLVMEDTPHYLH